MKYVKPEIAVLGEAAGLIESNTTKSGSIADGVPPGQVSSAYDLDE